MRPQFLFYKKTRIEFVKFVSSNNKNSSILVIAPLYGTCKLKFCLVTKCFHNHNTLWCKFFFTHPPNINPPILCYYIILCYIFTFYKGRACHLVFLAGCFWLHFNPKGEIQIKYQNLKRDLNC